MLDMIELFKDGYGKEWGWWEDVTQDIKISWLLPLLFKWNITHWDSNAPDTI